MILPNINQLPNNLLRNYNYKMDVMFLSSIVIPHSGVRPALNFE